MMSLQDMIGLSGLTEEEILAIAEHEHIPGAVATGLTSYLSHAEKGLGSVRDIIFNDIRKAQSRGDHASPFVVMGLPPYPRRVT